MGHQEAAFSWCPIPAQRPGSRRQGYRAQRGAGDTWWPRGQLGDFLSAWQTRWPWAWWGYASATAADLLHVKPPAAQLPKETRAAVAVMFFMGNG